MKQTIAALICVALAVTAACARAQSGGWKPEKNIELVVGVAAGSPNDVAARVIQKILQDRKLVDVSLAVVNKPGGGFAVGWNYLNQHAGNGHFIAMSALNLLSNPIMGANPLMYTDVTPIAQLFSEYVVFTVKGDAPLRSGRDIVERLRKDPAALSIAVSPGPGGANHVSAALMMKAAGIDFRKAKFVFFNSAIDSATAVLGGHVDVCATTSSSVVGQMTAGRMRIVAVAAPKRLGGDMAGIPTWKEQGFNVVADTFRGIIGPRGMSDAQIAYWENAFARLAQTDEWKAEVAAKLWENNFMGSRDSRKYLAAEYAEQKAILTELGLARQ